METQIENPVKKVKNNKGFDFSTLPKCIWGNDTASPCGNRASNGFAFCHHHRDKLNVIERLDPERLTIQTAIKLVNKTVVKMKESTELTRDDVASMDAILRIIKAGSEIEFKESSLIDAQTKLNNAIKKIASVLQEEIKSAPLFERIINKIIAIDLNETIIEKRKKIKASVIEAPPAPVIDETSETDDSDPADSATTNETPAELSPNTDIKDIQP